MAETIKDSNSRYRLGARVTWVGCCANIILSAFKLFAGIWGRSQAMIADAMHSFSDIATDIVVLWGFKVAGKPADMDHTFGHGRVETFVTFVVGASLIIVAIWIAWTGISTILEMTSGVYLYQIRWIAFIAAIVSIIVKEGMYRYTVKIGKQINSQAIMANAWHHRSDALTSIATLIGIGGALILGSHWRILDPIAALVVCFFIVRVAIRIARGSIRDLIDTAVSKETVDKIKTIIKSVPGVIGVHDIKTRSIGHNIALDVHITVNPKLTVAQGHDIATKIEDELKIKLDNVGFISVHIEPHEEGLGNG